MGEATALRREDSAGLIVAVALHVGVVALLLFQPAPPPMIEREERMTVSLASEVSLEATSPRPSPDARAAIAPTLSDQSVPPVEETVSDAAPTQANATPPPPSTRASTRRAAAPAPLAPDRNRSRPDRQPTASAEPKQTEGSRIGDDFLAGKGSSTESDLTTAPAAKFGRRERAALSSAITRQLRPHWTAPTGADAELLRSVVTWKLNADGSLAGRPNCRNIASSVTASNRPQAALHCERAIRAVQLAAPFNLPEPFYTRWKELEWEFNRRL